MKQARFLAAARQEFLAEIHYYNREQPSLGVRFAAAVEDATARALAFPLAGSNVTETTRKVSLKDFPFSVIYRPLENGILVVAVAHHAKRPGYWQSRIQDSP